MKEAKETRSAADLLTRQDILQYGLSFPGTYQEAPFHDPNWQLVRVKRSKKVFLWTYEKDGFLNLNVKVKPEWRDFWRNAYASHNRKSLVCSQRISRLFHTKLMKKRKKGEKLEKHTIGSRPKLGKLLNVGEK